jgi:adenosine deaminase
MIVTNRCFDMFKAVHALTTCPIAISLATTHVLQEFEDDGVVYLELRSTPREVPGKMTKVEYVDAIIQSIL